MRGGRGGQSACDRERWSREEFERELCRLWQTMAWMVLDKQGNGNQEVISKWSDRTIFVGGPRDHGGFLWGWTDEVELMNHLKFWGPLHCQAVDGERVGFLSSGFHAKMVLVHPLWFWAVNSLNPTCSLSPHHLAIWCISVYVQAQRKAEYCIYVKVRKSHQGLLPSLPQGSCEIMSQIETYQKTCLIFWNCAYTRVMSYHGCILYILRFRPAQRYLLLSFTAVDWFFAVLVFHQELFYWLNMHLVFPPPILVNFVWVYKA